jgi:putative transposase
MDLYSRHVLTWKLSNSLDTERCLDALEMALEGDRRPEVLHPDHNCQFSSGDFMARLPAEKIKISWSGRKRCSDNILVEGLWRTVDYVAADFSAEPSRGVAAYLQRWLGF